MITLWLATLLLAASAAAVVTVFATRAARAPAGEDPSLAVYRRQLSELDALAERGLLPEDERRAAHAEAGRRLLSAAHHREAPPVARAGRALLIAAAVAAPLAAFAVYRLVGQPAAPDQPYAARLAEWRAHPERYGPPELTAALSSVAAERPQDPEPLRRLSSIDIAQGDADGALHAVRKALAIAPKDTDLLTRLGVILVLKADGAVGPEARSAFQQVLALNPASGEARYYLARAKAAGGDAAGALADLQALAPSFPAGDDRRTLVDRDIAALAATGRLAPTPAAAPPTEAVQGAIQGMVDGLAARLKADPDDPGGWVRLVRAYTVLHETAKRDAALAQARARYAGQPDVLRQLDGAMQPPA